MRVESKFLKFRGSRFLRVCKRLFALPNCGSNNVVATFSFSFFINKTLHEPRQSPKKALDLSRRFKKCGFGLLRHNELVDQDDLHGLLLLYWQTLQFQNCPKGPAKSACKLYLETEECVSG